MLLLALKYNYIYVLVSVNNNNPVEAGMLMLVLTVFKLLAYISMLMQTFITIYYECSNPLVNYNCWHSNVCINHNKLWMILW